ncbi:M1 family metallopeptidase [Rhodoflexus caldus]|uniref:M1 family metallopeptidase n=1 Tax=Rhodoflexus caldus TaxID=2891236 RepID=UPI00202A00F2|nr:M1 family metallopeptidase [Rhodoflexus caldus]
MMMMSIQPVRLSLAGLVAVFFIYACQPKITQPGNTVKAEQVVSDGGDPDAAFEDSLMKVWSRSAGVWAPTRWKYNPERTRHFKLKHTKLEVSFNWQKQHLNGIATLTMQPYFFPQDSVILDAKGFDLHEIQLTGKINQPLGYSYDGNQIRIGLNKTYTRNEELTLRIRYTAKPNELQTQGSAAITDRRGLYFINPTGEEPNKPQQIWTQGETEASSCWFPTFDAPNVKTTQEIFITVDSAFVSLSNGRLISSKINKDGTRTDHWKHDKPHAPYLFMMAIGKYAVIKDKWRDKEVSYYVEPEYAPYARAIFGRTPEMMEFFSNLLDYPYPWDKYSQVVVRDFVSGAMENTSASVFMEQLQVDNRYLLDDNWDNIIAHELFHHWFGDLVTCESWANLPLNESFATYSEYLWQQHKYGQDAADEFWQNEWEQYLNESYTKREPLIRYYYREKEDMFDSHSYAKGGLILNMLRHILGDDAFFASLRLYLKKHQYGKAEIHDLRLAFEEVTGMDLNWFYDQWFMNPGHPELEVKHAYADGFLTVEVKQVHDTTYTPAVYRLPMMLDYWANGRKIRQKIEINQREQSFRFAVAQKPDAVLLDGETQLVGIIRHEKTVDEWMYQLKNADRMLARRKALDELQLMTNEAPGEDDDAAEAKLAAANEVLLAAVRQGLNDRTWQIRQMAVQVLESQEKLEESLIDKVQNMALNDEHSLVRASAVNALSGKINPSFFTNTMKDSSYTVLVNSLYAYANSGGEDAVSYVEQFEGVQNFLVVKTLAEFYSYFKVLGKYDWFVKTMARRNGYELNYMFNYFGSYLSEQPESVQLEGAKVLADYARRHSNYETRISAYGALVFIDEVPGVKALMEDVRKAEKDNRVLDYYRYMFNKNE